MNSDWSVFDIPYFDTYKMRVVSKNKESLDRLIKILSYEDPEWYLDGIISIKDLKDIPKSTNIMGDHTLSEWESRRVYTYNSLKNMLENNEYYYTDILKDGEYFYIDVSGIVMSSCRNGWTYISREDKNDLLCIGHEKDENNKPIWDKPIYGTSYRTGLYNVCKKLGMAFQVYINKPMNYVQILFNYNKESAEYHYHYIYDKLMDSYGEFKNCEFIYTHDFDKGIIRTYR